MLFNMFQPSLKEKFGDEQLLSTALAIELEDVKKTSVQLKLKNPNPHRAVYYIRKILKEMDSIDSGPQKIETREQLRDWNFFIGKFGNSKACLSFLTTANFLKKQKTKMIPIPIWYAIFAAQLFSGNLMVIASLSAPSLMDVAQHLANQCISPYL